MERQLGYRATVFWAEVESHAPVFGLAHATVRRRARRVTKTPRFCCVVLQEAQRWAAAALRMPDGQNEHDLFTRHVVDVISGAG